MKGLLGYKRFITEKTMDPQRHLKKISVSLKDYLLNRSISDIDPIAYPEIQKEENNKHIIRYYVEKKIINKGYAIKSDTPQTKVYKETLKEIKEKYQQATMERYLNFGVVGEIYVPKKKTKIEEFTEDIKEMEKNISKVDEEIEKLEKEREMYEKRIAIDEELRRREEYKKSRKYFLFFIRRPDEYDQDDLDGFFFEYYNQMGIDFDIQRSKLLNGFYAVETRKPVVITEQEKYIDSRSGRWFDIYYKQLLIDEKFIEEYFRINEFKCIFKN